MENFDPKKTAAEPVDLDAMLAELGPGKSDPQDANAFTAGNSEGAGLVGCAGGLPERDYITKSGTEASGNASVSALDVFKDDPYALPSGEEMYRRVCVAVEKIGAPAFPIPPGEKAAKLQDWPNLGACDPKVLRYMWTAEWREAAYMGDVWKSASSEQRDALRRARDARIQDVMSRPPGPLVPFNTGLVMGGDRLAVDVDRKIGPEAQKSLDALYAEGLPRETTENGTASGGSHLVFRKDPSVHLKNKTGAAMWKPGIEIKAERGYIVGPGSVIRGKGEYAIVNDAPVVDMPMKFIEDMLDSRKFEDRAPVVETSEYEDEWSIAWVKQYLSESTAAEGQRNEDLRDRYYASRARGITNKTYRDLVIECWAPLGTLDADKQDGYLNQIPNMASWADGHGLVVGCAHPKYKALQAIERAAESAEVLKSDAFDMDAEQVAKAAEPRAEKNEADSEASEAAESEKKEPYEFSYRASKFKGRARVERKWLVQKLIPRPNVTGLSGDGDTGKSLLLLQLAVAVALGRTWLGMEVEQGPVVFLSAEDDDDEIHNRLLDIAEAEGFDLGDLGDLHIIQRTGKDAVIGGKDEDGVFAPTALWDRVKALVNPVKPILIVFDTRADIYGGDENDRPQVRQFVGQLRGLALQSGAALVIAEHPSQSGRNNSSGESGSTAWFNSMRSRLYLTRPEGQDERKRDPNLRLLTTKKGNYSGGAGDERRLRWEKGRFVLTMGLVADTASDKRVRDFFLVQFDAYVARGISFGPGKGPNYAPKLFAEDKAGKQAGFGSRALADAMHALIDAGALKIDEIKGPDRKPRKVLLRVCEGSEKQEIAAVRDGADPKSGVRELRAGTA